MRPCHKLQNYRGRLFDTMKLNLHDKIKNLATHTFLPKQKNKMKNCSNSTQSSLIALLHLLFPTMLENKS